MGTILGKKAVTGKCEFIFNDNNSRIFVVQRTTLINANTSYLFDLDGYLIKEIIYDHGIKKAGSTKDNKYFWLISNQIRPLEEGERPLHQFTPYTLYMPYNHIVFFNSTTGNFEKNIL
jgi:hypothetical protein